MTTNHSVTRELPPLEMRAAFTPSTINVEARTVQLVWTTGARVLRGFFDRFYEELSLDPKHVRMDRLRNGAPLLDSHRSAAIADVIGVVESAQLERGRGTATVRFDRGEAGEDAFRKVSEGIVRNVSVGYRIHKLEKIEDASDGIPVFRATSWEPHELTLAPIGADAGATVRSADTSTNPCHFITENIMNENERDERVRGIRELATCAKLGDSWAMDQVEAGATIEQAREAAFDELARRDGPEISPHVRIESRERSPESAIPLMAEALASRFGGPPPSDGARQYLRLTTMDFARHLLEVRGVNTRHLSRNQIAERSIGGLHTTSDFPSLLTETGNRLLRAAYASYTGGLQRACRQASAQDFRPLQKLQLGEAPALLKVAEHGEFKSGTMASTKESYSLATFGRIFGLSRQAIVNDDLSAFGDMATRLGRAASEFVAVQLVTLLNSNPTLAADSKAVFHSDHNNLAASGTAISVTSLGVGLKSMRLQKGLDGVTAIDATPKFLIVPASIETVALQTIASITPAQTSNVNPFAGKLEPIVEPRLDATSATAWYLASDPSMIDTIEYAYLDGATGPEVFINEGFRIDGLEWKVRLDFGAGILDFRGLYKNPGA